MNWIKLSKVGLPKVHDDVKEFFIINSVGTFDIVDFHNDLKDGFNLPSGFYKQTPEGSFENVNDWIEYYCPCEYPEDYDTEQ